MSAMFSLSNLGALGRLGLTRNKGGGSPATTPQVEILTRNAATILTRDGSTVIARAA